MGRRRHGSGTLLRKTIQSETACRRCQERARAVEADRRARRLDPKIKTSVSYTHLMLGDYERSELFHDDPDIQATSLGMLGRVDEAVEVYANWAGTSHGPLIGDLWASTIGAMRSHRTECVEASRRILDSKLTDPEAIYCIARNLAHAFESLRTEIVISPEGFTIGVLMTTGHGTWAKNSAGVPPFLLIMSDHFM